MSFMICIWYYNINWSLTFCPWEVIQWRIYQCHEPCLCCSFQKYPSKPRPLMPCPPVSVCGQRTCYLLRMTNESLPSAREDCNLFIPGENGRHFAEDIFRCIIVNETFYISIQISLKFVPTGPIDNNQALFQIMAWCRIATHHYSNQCWPDTLTHICCIRGRWLNHVSYLSFKKRFKILI